MKGSIEFDERSRASEGVQRWLLQNGFNVVFALLISVIGWVTSQTLTDIRDDIQALEEASQALALEQQRLTARIEFLEGRVAVQADKQQEYDRANLAFWQQYGPVLERMQVPRR